MTASNTPDQRIDDLLIRYGDDCIDGKAVYTARLNGAKAALKSLFETMCAEIVGENKHSEHKEWDCPCGVTHSFTEEWHATNKLRDEQRQRIPQVISKYFEGGE